MKNSLCRSGYLRLVQKYCPSLTLSDLRPWPAGVRAQAVSPQGKLIDDFSLRYHRAFDTYLQCAIASGHLRYPDRRAYRQQGADPAGQPEQSRRTLRAARSVETLHAAFTR